MKNEVKEMVYEIEENYDTTLLERAFYCRQSKLDSVKKLISVSPVVQRKMALEVGRYEMPNGDICDVKITVPLTRWQLELGSVGLMRKMKKIFEKEELENKFGPVFLQTENGRISVL